MLHRDYPSQYCPVAATLEVVGERWTLLIIRDIFLGIRRFDDLQRDLGVARNVLQARLERLVEEGILVKRPYQERPPRSEYRLTEKGADLWPVLVALLQWGDRYGLEGERPMVLQHRGCGGELDDRRRCLACGADVTVTEAVASRTGATRPGRREAGAGRRLSRPADRVSSTAAAATATARGYRAGHEQRHRLSRRHRPGRAGPHQAGLAGRAGRGGHRPDRGSSTRN